MVKYVLRSEQMEVQQPFPFAKKGYSYEVGDICCGNVGVCIIHDITDVAMFDTESEALQALKKFYCKTWENLGGTQFAQEYWVELLEYEDDDDDYPTSLGIIAIAESEEAQKMKMYFDDDFGGVMTADGKYGVQLVKTSATLYPIRAEFVEGWAYDADCVCHNEQLGGECDIDDIPEDIVISMKDFMEEYNG